MFVGGVARAQDTLAPPAPSSRWSVDSAYTVGAGANVFAAAQIARELGPGRNVVTVLCDTGERYFSLDEYF